MTTEIELQLFSDSRTSWTYSAENFDGDFRSWRQTCRRTVFLAEKNGIYFELFQISKVIPSDIRLSFFQKILWGSFFKRQKKAAHVFCTLDNLAARNTNISLLPHKWTWIAPIRHLFSQQVQRWIVIKRLRRMAMLAREPMELCTRPKISRQML